MIPARPASEVDARSAASLCRVVIVEDDPPTLSALKKAVNAASGFLVAGASDRYVDGLTLLHGEYQLLLVDLDLGEHSGIDLIRASRQLRPEAKILVISVLGDERTVILALEAGADGYVLKDSPASELASALRAVVSGAAPISPGVALHLLRRFRQTTPQLRAPGARSDELSPRELQVLECLAQGLSYKEVAQHCELSVHTVGDYVKALYRKLQVRSRGQAVNLALKSGMLELDRDSDA